MSSLIPPCRQGHQPCDTPPLNAPVATRRQSRRNVAQLLFGFTVLVLAGVATGFGRFPVVIAATAALGLFAVCKKRVLDLLIAFGVLTVGFSGIEVGPMTAPDLFLAPAAILLTLRYALSWRAHIPLWLVGSAAILLSAGLLAQGVFPDLPERSFVIMSQFIVSLVYVPLVLSLGTRSHAALNRVGVLFVLSAAINSSFGLLEFYGITDIASRITGFQGFPQNGGRPAGFTAHPNQLGLLCVLALPFAIHLYRRTRLWAVSLLLLFFGVMVSGSRTALIGFFVAAAATLWMQGRLSSTSLIKGALALTLLGVIATSLGVDLALSRITSEDSSVTYANEARTDSITAAFGDILAYPLTGVGFGKNAHSLYLQILQGAGVLALLGFLWFATEAVQLARRLRNHAAANAAGAAMIAWLVTGLVHPGLYDRYLYVPAGIIIGARLVAKSDTLRAIATTPSGANRPADPAISAVRRQPKRLGQA